MLPTQLQSLPGTLIGIDTMELIQLFSREDPGIVLEFYLPGSENVVILDSVLAAD